MKRVLALAVAVTAVAGCSGTSVEVAECTEEYEKLAAAEQSATVTDDVIDDLSDYFEDELVYFTYDDRTIGGTTPEHPGGDCPVPR